MVARVRARDQLVGRDLEPGPLVRGRLDRQWLGPRALERDVVEPCPLVRRVLGPGPLVTRPME